MSAWRMAAVLFIVAAALFVVGVAVERSGGHHDEPAGRAVTASEQPVGGEGSPEHEAVEHATTLHNSAVEHDDTETVLGVDVESPATITAALVVSAGVAVGLWMITRRWMGVVAVILAAVFVVFDVNELAHQVSEQRLGVAVIAAMVALGHVAAGGLATRPQRATPA